MLGVYIAVGASSLVFGSLNLIRGISRDRIDRDLFLDPTMDDRRLDAWVRLRRADRPTFAARPLRRALRRDRDPRT